MSTRYFQKQDSTKPVGTIKFEGYDMIGGKLWGVWATENPEEITALEAAVADKRQGVYEISQEEYAATQQKKTLSSNSYGQPSGPTPVVSQTPLQALAPPAVTDLPIKGQGAVVDPEPVIVPDDSPPADSGTEPVPKVTDALKTADVEPPPTAPPRQSRKKGKR